MFTNQPAFEVHIHLYGGGVFCHTQHRTITGACRSLASVIADRKRTFKALDRAYIWCARDNNTYTLNRARELIAQGYFDGPAYR